MLSQPKTFFLEILKNLGKLTIAGLLLGLLREYHWVLAAILFLRVAHVCYKKVFKTGENNWILFTGMILTGIFGLIGEYWGTSNDYWEYNDVTVSLPAWLPFAWMLAFHYLYRLEKKLTPCLKNPSFTNQVLLMIFLTIVIPAYGEMIAIAAGVWQYYWPYQIFGVPVYAFIALVFVHMLVYAILYYLFKNHNEKDFPFTTAR
ncbi:hypothetical protein [Nonlabens ponticola]|uniref:Uncharacterized protein n=1 Tax=Nonlabens ponticola TaxID=2496866 RepID=A0A3S9MYD6_9FLAO|nr:hypothetical protein [Nonlabens ponticola]AZQ44168.1 hypothetical protein EJ995_07960 [Nonlabens ponticola]